MNSRGLEPVPVEPELARINRALYDEFVRSTGRTSRYEFGDWVANLRTSIAAGDDALMWAELTAPQQSTALLLAARGRWPLPLPSLDLSAFVSLEMSDGCMCWGGE